MCIRDRVARWREAGLTNLNISVDALDRDRFHAITGHDRLEEILRGIELARGLGFKACLLYT